MIDRARNIAILGATGSIGRNSLDVIAQSGGRLRAFGLTAHSQLDELADQARQLSAPIVVATDATLAEQQDWGSLPSETKLLTGESGLEELAGHADVDIVVSAIVGSAGLRGAWAALESGATLALANKETLVMAGPLVTDLARRRKATILPVDSEHSAIFQALQNGKRSEVKRVVLTASGGPFRNHTAKQLEAVTVEDALAHPTWSMGRKITVDSATMMNKALEVIEARWLFDLRPDQIDVVVHPQSIVHSLVEYLDGSVIAQLSPPDMRLPIQYALTWPDRWTGPARKLDLTQSFSLDFEPPDEERFPALQLGREAAAKCGTTGAVLNAANEAAVSAFLDGAIRFTQIIPACRAALDQHNFDPSPTLDQLIQLDGWAREEVTRWIHT
jgi:1-deoxy-D-xylulose-5-phosphate reductoisomerase